MKAYISKRAARAADRIDARWREHGADAGIFAREFLQTVERLETTRGIGSPFQRLGIRAHVRERRPARARR